MADGPRRQSILTAFVILELQFHRSSSETVHSIGDKPSGSVHLSGLRALSPIPGTSSRKLEPFRKVRAWFRSRAPGRTISRGSGGGPGCCAHPKRTIRFVFGPPLNEALPEIA